MSLLEMYYSEKYEGALYSKELLESAREDLRDIESREDEVGAYAASTNTKTYLKNVIAGCIKRGFR